MRNARIALVGALLLGAAACQTDDGSAVGSTIPPLAFVRYINAVPDTNNLTVRWVDQLEFSPQTFVNVPFRGMGQGGYQGLEAGSRHFRVFTYDPRLSTPTGGLPAVTAQLADTTFDFVAGQYYTILHLGYARTGSTPAQRVYIMQDQLPAAGTTVSVRAIHAVPGAPAVDVFATAAAPTTLTGATPIAANIAANGTSAYVSRATGALAVQLAATGTTGSLFNAVAPAGVAGTAAADPIAGAAVGGSVLTAIAFPAPVAGSPAAGLNVVEATGRSIDTVFAIAGGYQLNDLAAASWATNRFVATANSSWSLVVTPAACPTVTAPTTIRCETRPAAATVAITGNTANTFTTAASLAAFPRAYYFDTLKTPVASSQARLLDSVYAVAGGYEIRDVTPVPWVAGQFNQVADTSFIVTITPPTCPTAPTGGTRVCQTRPAAATVRLTGNGTNTLVTAADISAHASGIYTDTLKPAGTPASVSVQRATFSIVRDVHARSVRSTFAINGTNPPALVWFSDRQPARTTTP